MIESLAKQIGIPESAKQLILYGQPARRKVEVALPGELIREQQLELILTCAKDNFVAAGMCADFALHNKGDGNSHAHILLTIHH